MTQDPVPGWPSALRPIAFSGPAGDLIRLIEPHSEADPAALLILALVILGNVIGPVPALQAGGARHPFLLFAVLVGLTSKGRKGTAFSSIRYALRDVEPELSDPDRVLGGLSSGEGFVYIFRDAIRNGDAVEDPGVSDKRKLIFEPEFARVLKTSARDGNTLSAILRQAWDCETLASLTKGSPLRATGAHPGILGNITRDELRRHLTETETANGLANRFLWVCVRRSKLLPEGGDLGAVNFSSVARRLADAVNDARNHRGPIERDAEAKELWAERYGALSEGTPGLLGSATSRAEAQVLRLSGIYAALDMSYVVRAQHLEAALEVWRYCFDSARFIFGDSLGDPVADELDAEIRRAGAEGMTRTELRDYFGRNKGSREVQRALSLLQEHNRIRMFMDETSGGRPAERWLHNVSAPAAWSVSGSYDINDKSPLKKEPLLTPLRHTTKVEPDAQASESREEVYADRI